MSLQGFSYQDFLQLYRACRHIDLRSYTAEGLRAFLMRHFQSRSPALAVQAAGLSHLSMQLLYAYLSQRRALYKQPPRPQTRPEGRLAALTGQASGRR